MNTHIYLTRHGETVWNTKKLMQGWKDSPLTEKGINQAERLADWFSDISIDAIYSSTSDRAIHTGNIIKKDRILEIYKVDDLREMSFGMWEGKSFEENEKDYPKEWRTFWESPHLFSHHTIESFLKVQERMVNTVQSLVQRHPSGKILIVTHSIALKLLMNYFENEPIEKLWETPAILPTSLSLVKLNNAKSQIVFKYSTEHLVI